MSGELLEQLEIGALVIRVTRSCARRDLYDVQCGRPLPLALRDAMLAWEGIATHGSTCTGGDALWIVDVPGVHRITVSAATGRIVILPRMDPPRSAQRASALALCHWLASTLPPGGDTHPLRNPA